MAGKEIDHCISRREIGEKCAVFGIISSSTPEVSKLTAQGLFNLQHRGQEGSGITTSDGQRIYSHRRQGLVSQVFDDIGSDFSFKQLPGHISSAHNRYSTFSRKKSPNHHLQPVIDKANTLTLAHNGNLPDTDKLEAFLQEKGIGTAKLNDSEMMHQAILHFIKKGASLEEAVIQAVPNFTGAFSILVMDNNQLIAVRDKNGTRPFSIGSLNGGYVFSSETCALDQIGARYIRDVGPGEIVVSDGKRLFSTHFAQPDLKLDIFEFVYFARPDSNILGKNVHEVRENLGRILAEEEEIFPDADLVIAVPDSATPAAIGYSKTSGIPFGEGFVKNRYIGRTFITPGQEKRMSDVSLKLNPLPQVINGRKIIVVEDSMVRATTSMITVKMLRDAGASEVHMRITSPPIRFPEYNGVDTPSQKELIAYGRDETEIGRQIGVDSLRYLSQEGMVRATGLAKEVFSMSCFDGKYTIDIGKRRDEIDFGS